MLNDYESLKLELQANDAKFRAIARAMCKSSSVGDDLYHSSVLKLLELSLTGVTINDLQKFLYSIMTTTRLDMYRNFNNKTLSLESEIINDIVYSTEDYMDNRDILAKSLKFISQLKNEQDKEIFISKMNGIKIKTIAKAYNIGVNSIKSKIRRVREALKLYIKNEN